MEYLEQLLLSHLPDRDETESLKRIADDIIGQINSICLKAKIDAVPIEVGSVSKHTNLKCSDIDIFITFSKEYSTEFIEKKGLEIGHTVLKNGIEKYAEHPYVSGTIDNISVDIVPSFMIEKGQHIVSTVDRTPLHTEYVNNNTDPQKIHDILLLKVFMKLINVYGSEIAVSGFSGYLCEVLIIHFGSFENFIKHMSGLKGKLRVPEDFPEERYREPVIIIDPVDPNRNAGAAVSEENLARLKLASNLYISGNYSLFKDKGEIHENRGTFIKIFTMPRPDIIDDIIYPQAVRLGNKLFKIFSKYGFMPVSSEIYCGKNIQILIEYEREEMPELLIHQGPPVYSSEAIKFINIWQKSEKLLRGPYIMDNRVYVDIKNNTEQFDTLFRREIEKTDIGKNLDEFKNDINVINYKNGMKLEVVEKFYSKYLFS